MQTDDRKYKCVSICKDGKVLSTTKRRKRINKSKDSSCYIAVFGKQVKVEKQWLE